MYAQVFNGGFPVHMLAKAHKGPTDACLGAQKQKPMAEICRKELNAIQLQNGPKLAYFGFRKVVL